jgi:hypothetical protein
MHTPDTPGTPGPHPEHTRGHGISSTGYGAPSPGYETSDVRVTGIIVFLVSLMVFLVIFFVFCFGMGKVINSALIRHDGPPNKWNQYNFAEGKGKNLESNAVLEQQQLQKMTARFPTPQLQTDDGNQDIADMHAREDLLLDHYTWVDQSKGTIRIPIGQAMQILAQRGLPVTQSQAINEPLMTADTREQVTPPLTNGFARTGYEQQREVEENRQQQQHQEPKTGQQARLAPPQR